MNIQGIHATAIPMAASSNGSTNSSNSTNSSTTSSSNTQLSQSSFLQLIATELQAQDPSNPLDPTQFMGQLVQFDTLDQVTGIYNILSQGASATAATGDARTPSSPATTGSSTSSPSSATQGL